MGAARLLASIIHHGLLKREVDAWQPDLHAGQLVLVTLGWPLRTTCESTCSA